MNTLPPHSTQVRLKICGLTRPEDVDAAVHVGADALGFVFYPQSPRAIAPERALSLIRRIPPFIQTVGLFVNADPKEVYRFCEALPFSLLQFHGDETPEYCAQFSRPYLKAIRVQPGLDLLESARLFSSARGLLLDAFTPVYGGSGHTFDWSLVPDSLPLPIILSGGLTVENVASAIKQTRPSAVDVSSGVEVSKGIKDHQKMAAFAAAVRKINEQLHPS